MPDEGDDAVLLSVLHDAARSGFLGSSDPRAAIEHARGFGEVLRPATRVVDLGSGGGLPGLVLAADRPALVVVLLDASQRRTDFLRRAVGRLGVADRVQVVWRRAEALGRDPAWRSSADAVVARSFGPPGVVAECAAPLLRVGGQLVVSEPPTPDPRRWPAEGLAEVALVRDVLPTDRYVSCTLVGPCPDRFPRRSLKVPLF